MRNLSLLIIFLFSTMAFATPDKKGDLMGKIMDENGFEVSYAAVDLIKDGTIINGAISTEDGSFKIEATEYGTYTIEVKATGYKTYTAEVKIDARDKSIGTITLIEDAVTLDEARIEVSQIRQEIDKRVIEVGKDLVNAGATAVEVLDKVPSLQVDQQSGELSLRGNSNVRVFVDGKPSTIPVSQLLRQLPSNSIKQVEIITNPSAKYDPEGNSGIVNIITHKGKLKGYNVNVNAGFTAAFKQRYTLGVNGNYNTGKVNLFGNYNTNFGERFLKGEIDNLDTNIGQSIRLDQKPTSHLFKVGFDWFINDKTALTVYTNQSFFDGENTNNATISNLANNTFVRDLTDSDDENRNQDYSLNFKRDFEKKDHSIELDAFYAINNNEGASQFNWGSAITQETGDEDINNPTDPNDIVRSFDLSTFNQSTDRDQTNTRINLDYTNTVWEFAKIETGIQFRNEGIENSFITNQQTLQPDIVDEHLLTDDPFDTDDNFSQVIDLPSGNYDFNRDIYSTYLNVGFQLDKFGFQVGTRLENVQENADFVSFDGDVSLNDTDNIERDYTEFYPSLFMTYDLAKRTQLSFNVSRRVDRPQVNQLNPIREFQTANVRSIGNPDLLPQFTYNYELGFLRRFKGGKGNINASIFYRDISDAITRFLTVDPENPAGTTTLLQYTNLDDNESYGFEVSGFYKPLKWWTFNTSFDIFNNKILGPDGDNIGEILEIDQTVFNVRLSNDFKVTKTINLQLFTMYRGENDFLQGTQKPMFLMDFGVRKSFAKGKGSISARVSDIFDTFHFEGDIRNPFRQDAEFNWGQQSFYVGLNYSFGGKVKTRADKQRNQSQNSGGGGIGF